LDNIHKLEIQSHKEKVSNEYGQKNYWLKLCKAWIAWKPWPIRFAAQCSSASIPQETVRQQIKISANGNYIAVDIPKYFNQNN